MKNELSNIDAALRSAYLSRTDSLSASTIAQTVLSKIRIDAEEAVSVEEATNLIWRVIPAAALLVLVALESVWRLGVGADLPYEQALAFDPLASLTWM